MGHYLARRVAGAVVTLFFLSTALFFVFEFIPGDPALVMLGTEASSEALEALREEFGFNRPVLARYADWLRRVVRWDFGRSIQYGRPIKDILAERLPVTVLLALAGTAVSVVLSIPAGVYAAARRGTAGDLVTSAASQLGVALPSFWVGLLLILVFSAGLRLLPPGGVPDSWGEGVWAWARHLALPALALGAGRAAVLARLTRSTVADVLRQDYIRTARSKGLTGSAVIYRHALKNAMIPVVTVLGLQVGALLGGSIVIERVFFLPGLGRLLLSAIDRRDLPLVQCGVLVMAMMVVAVNFCVDIAYGFLNPRIRWGDGG